MYNDVTPSAQRTGLSAPDTSSPIAASVLDVTGIAMNVLGLPFDVARAQYACAVQLGLVERSMLASRNFSRILSALERLALGPWARHV
nr:hypothetical protein [Rhodoferax sp.]